METWGLKNLAAAISARVGSWINIATAGAASNGAVVTGTAIQRSQAFGPNKMPLSVAIQLLWSATLAAGKTLYLGAVTIEDSADGVNFATYALMTDPGVVWTGPTGGGTLVSQNLLTVNLTGARDWIRLKYTPTLSATATDSATIVGRWHSRASTGSRRRPEASNRSGRSGTAPGETGSAGLPMSPRGRRFLEGWG